MREKRDGGSRAGRGISAEKEPGPSQSSVVDSEARSLGIESALSIVCLALQTLILQRNHLAHGNFHSSPNYIFDFLVLIATDTYKKNIKMANFDFL